MSSPAPTKIPEAQEKKKIPAVFGSNVNNLCPECGNLSLPHFTGTASAVACQNPNCRYVLEKDKVIVVMPAAAPVAAVPEEVKPVSGPDHLMWLRFAENTDQHRLLVEARVKQLTRAARIFRQNAETGVPFDRVAAMQLLGPTQEKL